MATEKPDIPFDDDHQPDLFREAEKSLRGALSSDELWALADECNEQSALLCEAGHRLTAELVEKFGAWVENEAARRDMADAS